MAPALFGGHLIFFIDLHLPDTFSLSQKNLHVFDILNKISKKCILISRKTYILQE